MYAPTFWPPDTKPTSPLNLDVWTTELANDFDEDFLLDGIAHGFNVIDVSSDNLKRAEMHNYKSAKDNPYREKVERQINHEIFCWKL